ncbi:MAG: hypothetical protein CMH30_09245 [Micavibrio sp.]|nr:hypothetical protein [Micavibrio sp.]|tara:strand:+ start:4232 stop:4636 length:405 start_codon:yes stop_codon:yes gene_type:complete
MVKIIMPKLVVAILFLLFLCACAGPKPYKDIKTNSYKESISDATPVIEKKGKIRPQVDYKCENGKNFSVFFDKKALYFIIFKSGDDTHVLQQVRSGSGARYTSSEGYEYWTKGKEALVSFGDNHQYSCMETNSY